MANFVQMTSQTTWPHDLGPYGIGNDFNNTVEYYQDAGKLEKVQRKMPDFTQNVVPTNRYEPNTRENVTQESVLWISKALQEKAVLPFAAAGATAFFVLPVFDRGIGIGAALVSAYFAGAVTYYLEFMNNPIVRKPDSQIDKLDTNFTRLQIQPQPGADKGFSYLPAGVPQIAV